MSYINQGTVLTLALRNRMSDEHIRKTIEFLANPASYPYAPARVRLLQTHASIVAIASPFVYKVKKPVNLGFLDFSTLERRKYYCYQEKELNERLCRDVYKSVEDIRMEEGHLRFGGVGEIFDYALVMAELDEEEFLLSRLQSGRITSDDIERTATKMAAYYNASLPDQGILEAGRAPYIKKSTDENFDLMRKIPSGILPAESRLAIERYTDRFFDWKADLFEKRIQEKRILDCHGDLHMEHIHLRKDGDVDIFDCIEFNERFRHIDTACDTAFLCMDLDFHHRHDLSLLYAKRIEELTGDPDLETMLNFYKVYRACIRGKVNYILSIEDEILPEKRENSARLARKYFQLALSCAFFGPKARAIVIMGNTGSGKSTLALKISQSCGCAVFSSDRIRKEAAGLPVEGRPSDEDRKKIYTTQMTQRTYDLLASKAREELEAGRSVVLDATFSKSHQREAIKAQLEGRVLFLELQAPDEEILERLKMRESNAKEISDARAEDFETISGGYEKPSEEEAIHLRSDSGAYQNALYALTDRNL